MREQFRLFAFGAEQQTVVDRDGDVARDGAQDLDVLARDERAVGRLAAHTDQRDHPVAHDARHEVMNPGPLAVGGLLGKGVATDRGVRPRPSREVGRQRHIARQTRRKNKAVLVGRLAVLDEDRQLVDREHSPQPGRKRREQRVEVGGRGEGASELAKSLAERVALAIEQPVGGLLQPRLDWREQDRDQQHYGDGHGARDPCRRVGVDLLDRVANGKQQREIEGSGRRRDEHVHEAAADDHVDVHHPVPDDGVAKAEGHKDQRTEREDVVDRRHGPPHQARRGIEERVRNRREPDTPRDPLQLELERRRLRLQVRVDEQQVGGDDPDRKLEDPKPVEQVTARGEVIRERVLADDKSNLARDEQGGGHVEK